MRTYTSEREVRRTAVFSRVVKAGWTLLEAAERMEVSYRQAKRRWKRYRGEGGGVDAWERGAGLEPGEAQESAADSVGTDGEEVWGRARGALWTDTSSGTLGEGRRDPVGGREAAKVDAGGRVVEARTEKAGAAAEGGAEGAFGEVSTTGRKLSRLAGRAGAAGLPDEQGGSTGTTLCRMGEEETIWAAVGVVRAWIECYGVPQALRGLEERVCTGAQRE